MSKNQTLIAAVCGLLVTGLSTAVPAVAAPTALTTQSIIRLLAQFTGRSHTQIIHGVAQAGLPHVCDVFNNSVRHAGLLKVCWSSGRWTATLPYPPLYNQPTFSTLAHRISKQFGAPVRAPRPYLVSPKMDVWPARPGRARISLVRPYRSEMIEIRISGSTR